MSDLLTLKGYGFYIWGSYLVTGALMVLEIILIRRRRKTLNRRLNRIGRMQARQEDTRLDQ